MPLAPYVQDADFTLYVGDVRDVLSELPDESVDCVVTSPPYWGLRDYGTDGQLGLEPTPDAYVTNMVGVFREVRRVLVAPGTCWVNLGDSYAGQPQRPAASALSAQEPQSPSYPSPSSSDRSAPHLSHVSSSSPSTMSSSSIGPLSTFKQGARNGNRRSRPGPAGTLEAKQLVGIPWKTAFALQTDGWYLRSDIVWAKPNPMPESVTDRPTKAHEYVFLLTKQPRYFFDQEAVREPAEWAMWGAQTVPKYNGTSSQTGWMEPKSKAELEAMRATGRNVRSVWEIATQAYPEAHFATYPEELVRRCILAGCPEWVCGTCGKPRERIVERGELVGKDRGGNYNGREVDKGVRVNPGTPGLAYELTTTGWSDCGHNNYRPGTVLDPFMGSGTTALVARQHGRHAIGIELNQTYAAMCAKRLQQLSLLAEGTA